MEADPRKPLSRSRRSRSRRKASTMVWRALGVVVFVVGIYLSARFGIFLAKNRFPTEVEAAALPEESTLTLGRPFDPVYLGTTSEDLRSFFSRYSSPGQRASANLTDLPVRRISSAIEMKVLRSEADAVEVEITSGPIAGATYWIHHSQMPDPSAFDPILSPIPEAQPQKEGEN